MPLPGGTDLLAGKIDETSARTRPSWLEVLVGAGLFAGANPADLRQLGQLWKRFEALRAEARGDSRSSEKRRRRAEELRAAEKQIERLSRRLLSECERASRVELRKRLATRERPRQSFIDAMLAERKKPVGKREKHARRNRLRRLPESLGKIADAIGTAEARQLVRLPGRLVKFAIRFERDFVAPLSIVDRAGASLSAVLRNLARNLAAGKATPDERREISEWLRLVADNLKWLLPRYHDRSDRARAAENALARHIRPRELAELLGEDDEGNVRRRLARRWRELAAEQLGEDTRGA
jgi:hypothetical protein